MSRLHQARGIKSGSGREHNAQFNSNQAHDTMPPNGGKAFLSCGTQTAKKRKSKAQVEESAPHAGNKGRGRNTEQSWEETCRMIDPGHSKFNLLPLFLCLLALFSLSLPLSLTTAQGAIFTAPKLFYTNTTRATREEGKRRRLQKHSKILPP